MTVGMSFAGEIDLRKWMDFVSTWTHFITYLFAEFLKTKKNNKKKQTLLLPDSFYDYLRLLEGNLQKTEYEIKTFLPVFFFCFLYLMLFLHGFLFIKQMKTVSILDHNMWRVQKNIIVWLIFFLSNPLDKTDWKQ